MFTTRAKLQEAEDKSPSDFRVTRKGIEERIKEYTFSHPAPKTTLCLLVLDNGFEVTGQSCCADPANYNPDIGEHYAYQDAIHQLEPMFGFMVAEQMMHMRSCGIDDAMMAIMGTQSGD